MTELDPMFRQRLRNQWRDVQRQLLVVAPGSRAYFKLDALERAIDAAYVELYREDIQPVHSGPHVPAS